MAPLSEIRGLIVRYLINSIDLSQFAERFSALSCDIEDSKNDYDIQLSYKIESVLSKASEGFLSLSELRAELYRSISSSEEPVCQVRGDVVDEYRDQSVVRLNQVEASSSYAQSELLSA